MTLVVLLASAEGVLAQSSDDGATGTDHTPPKAAVAPPPDTGGLSDSEQQALGCAMVAGAGLAATAVAGSTEIMMLWGGGMLIPSRASTLWMALFAQIGVSGCALGAIATPTVLWAIDQSDNIAAKAAQISSHVGQQIVDTSVWAGTLAMSTLSWWPGSSSTQ